MHLTPTRITPGVIRKSALFWLFFDLSGWSFMNFRYRKMRIIKFPAFYRINVRTFDSQKKVIQEKLKIMKASLQGNF